MKLGGQNGSWYHKVGPSHEIRKDAFVVISRSVLPTKMLLRILLACLTHVNSVSFGLVESVESILLQVFPLFGQ